MVKWSHQARRDLRRIFDYIAQDSPHYARKVTQEIAARTGVLNELPRIGKMTPEVGDDHIRELSIYTYRVLYEIQDDGAVEILAIVHKRRAMKSEDVER